MAKLQLVYAPDPIFKRKSLKVTAFNDELKELTSEMLEVLYREKGIGLGANMVGVLQRIIVVDLQENGERTPLVCINPEIRSQSEETTTREEASLCFPGIRVEIERPTSIELDYQDIDGQTHTMKADGWLATVIQHEMEYLDGKTFLDNLSKLKRDRLIKKMLKDMKNTDSCGDPQCGDPLCGQSSL